MIDPIPDSDPWKPSRKSRGRQVSRKELMEGRKEKGGARLSTVIY